MLPQVGILLIDGAVLVVGLLLMIYVMNSLKKARAAYKGRDRCHYCGTRLGQNLAGLGYANRCRGCGRPSPWAEADR